MYSPLQPPPQYTQEYLRRELLAISQAIDAKAPWLILQTLNVAPTKPQEGMIVVADGTNWNPGSGAGAYLYRGAAWRFLG